MSTPHYRILVVEDNPNDVELLRMALHEADVDFEFTVIDDGGEALAFVEKQSRPESRPDLAILDLNLPRRDGVEVLNGMRANPLFSDVPVAVFSSSSLPRERARVEALHIRRYIQKPTDLDEFLKIGGAVKELLSETSESH
ncbi:MAG TPA: response regulator [Bryobacteraceae bacterium]|jgi:two-component system, chemotaxis family, response regulator Rcp1|nr:response regulator [Bryobacteraceae bacterium]